jgi:serine hydrolase
LASLGGFGAVILVGAYHSALGDANEMASGYFDDEWDWEAIRLAKPALGLFQFGGMDDPFLPPAEQDTVAREAGAKYFRFEPEERRGHFMTTEFPELLDLIRELAVRSAEES